MDQRTVETYDAKAGEYDDKTAVFWDLFPRTFLDAFVAASGREILDVGCGPGRDGLLLQEAGKNVTGLDASGSMVHLAQKRGLRAIAGDFDTLPFPDAHFDGVWSYTTLLHVPKAEVGRPLVEIRRVLKPDGVFALGLIEGDGEGYRERDNIGEGFERWFSYYQKDEVESLLSGIGFEPVYFETFKPGKRMYLNFIFRRPK